MEEYYKEQREEVRELVDEIIELVIKKNGSIKQRLFNRPFKN